VTTWVTGFANFSPTPFGTTSSPTFKYQNDPSKRSQTKKKEHQQVDYEILQQERRTYSTVQLKWDIAYHDSNSNKK